MGLFPPEIVEHRSKQFHSRVESLNSTETKHYSFQLAALGIIELTYVATFAVGVVTDTIKAGIGSNNDGPKFRL